MPTFDLNTSSSIERKLVFVQPSFSQVIERAGVHFCPDVFNGNYRNVSVLLSTLLSKWSGTWAGRVEPLVAVFLGVF